MVSQSGTCKLCHKVRPLLKSHIIPAFVFRWQKKTSTTGIFRSTENPNRRLQDGWKRPYLCKECESVLNSYETPFANQIFHPFHENPKQSFPYQEWMLKFCVSLSWRTLHFATEQEGISTWSNSQQELIFNAEKTWRSFLLGKRPHPGDYEQHFIAAGLPENVNGPNVPVNISMYLARAVGTDIFFSEDSKKFGFTYTKIGTYMVFGALKKPPEKWLGTKVHVKHGTIKPRNLVIPDYIFKCIFDHARMVDASKAKLSSKENDKITKAILDNLDKFVDSGEFTAGLKDHNMKYTKQKPNSK